MSNVAKLRKQAAELEQRKQLDKALAKYIQILDALGDHFDEADIALFNRVGDLLMRQGNVSEAVDYYERAVDLYTEGGFFNNAIALCNKILRNAPGRTSVYYKLGRISAKKGFIADAKQNFLEYADRMQRAGQMEDAFRAMAELADLCPDQEDIRLMLADHLARSDRKGEAIEQLQRLYEKLEAEGRSREARATADRMRAIDPEVAPRPGKESPPPRRGDLVFLDVNYDASPSLAPPEPEGRHRDSSKGGLARGLPLIMPDLPEGEEMSTPSDLARRARDPEPAAPDLPALGQADVPSLAEPDVPASAEPDALAPEELDAPAPAEPDAPGLEVTVGAIEGLVHTSMLIDEPIESTSIAGLESALPGFEPPPAISGEQAPVEADDLPMIDVIEFEGDPAGPVQDLAILHTDEMGVILDPPAAQADAGTAAPASPEGPRDFPPLSIEIRNEQSAQLAADDDDDATTENGDLPPILRDELREPVKSLIEIDLVEEEPPLPPPPDAPSRTRDEDLDEMGLILEPPGPRTSSEQRAVGEPAHESADAAADDADGDVGGALPLITPAVEEPVLLGFELPRPWSEGPAELEVPEHLLDDPPPRERDEPPQPALELSAVDKLRQMVAAAPTDGHTRQQLGEALLEAGDRTGGMRALEDAMATYERAGDFAGARSVVEEILRLEPNSTRHHQKRVEYTFRLNDRGRLVDAYLGLADCLFRSGQVDKCRAVYERVVELAPEDRRAREALRAFDPDSIPDTPAETPAVAERDGRRNGEAIPERRESFVNLASWLAEDDEPKSTRMVADVEEPADAQEDFRRMLDMFKQGVAANVDEADHESHYDLGVAYKEMGLLDEAIAEFQKALRGTENRVRTYEALGQCFVEKRQFQIAVTILSRAIADPRYTDEVLVGVLYLLGEAYETLGQKEDARACYERIVSIDIGFRDASDRLAVLDGGGRR